MEEDAWPPNPWQAQADAHVAELQRAAAFAPPERGTGSAALAMGSSRLQGCAGCAGPGVVSMHVPVAQVYQLEGVVALLEDQAARRDGELAELQAKLSAAEAALEGRQASPDQEPVSDVQRHNDFLTMLVNRYEAKTMDLEKEIARLILSRREADEQYACLEAQLSGERSPSDSAKRELELQETRSELQQLQELETRAEELEIRAEQQQSDAATAEWELEATRSELQEADAEVNVQRSGMAVRNLEFEALRAELRGAERRLAEPRPRDVEDRWRQLGLQAFLLEAFRRRRASHDDTQSLLRAARGENDTLSFRIDRLVEQLQLLCDLNTSLEEELELAKSSNDS